MHVRRALPADAAAMVPLCVAHAAYEGATLPGPPSPDALQAALWGPFPRLYAWIASVNDEMVGYGSGSLTYCTWSASTYFLMDALFIEEAYRGIGLGADLLGAMRDFACSKQCTRMEWLTPTWNTSALGFYESRGAVCQERIRLKLSLDRDPL
ncbi:GNAT family N-acetyltransferase [Pseudoxanthomonas japonensis]|nr:GNAT family N-acetyltransferase [Pseudoxanthomonas japonensis]